MDHLFGRQRLVRIGRRTLLLAAAALGAGVKVEDVFPVQFADLAQAEGLPFFVFDVGLEDGLFALQGLQENVGGCRQQVQVFGPRNVDQKAQNGCYVDPVADLVSCEYL